MTTLFDKYSDDYEAAMRRANGFLAQVRQLRGAKQHIF